VFTVHNSWFDRWIVLKILQEFSKAVFLGVALKLLLDTVIVWSGHTKYQTRVPAQEIRNSWSDRWIVLKFIQEFPEGVFLGVALKLLLDTHSVLSGHTKNQTRVPTQEVCNFWSYCWIVLNFLQEFEEACFLGVTMKSQWEYRWCLVGPEKSTSSAGP
jgi:hypothetical protein